MPRHIGDRMAQTRVVASSETWPAVVVTRWSYMLPDFGSGVERQGTIPISSFDTNRSKASASACLPAAQFVGADWSGIGAAGDGTPSLSNAR